MRLFGSLKLLPGLLCLVALCAALPIAARAAPLAVDTGPLALARQDPAPADSTVDQAPSAGTQIISWGGMAWGALGVTVTTLLKTVASRLDGTTKQWDGTLTALLKPIQPLVAGALAVGIPWLASHTGIHVDAAAFTAAPAGTVIGIGVRELLVKLGHLTGAIPK